jgi:hypothetical protein
METFCNAVIDCPALYRNVVVNNRVNRYFDMIRKFKGEFKIINKHVSSPDKGDQYSIKETEFYCRIDRPCTSSEQKRHICGSRIGRTGKFLDYVRV